MNSVCESLSIQGLKILLGFRQGRFSTPLSGDIISHSLLQAFQGLPHPIEVSCATYLGRHPFNNPWDCLITTRNAEMAVVETSSDMMSRLTTTLLNDQDSNSGHKSWATCIVYIWERMREEKVLPSELIPVSVAAGKIYALILALWSASGFESLSIPIS